MQVVLVMFRSDGERRSFSVVRDVTVIGRREDCDLRIPLGDVSRKHCRLIKEEDSLRVEDLGSSNGTHVNGQRVQEAELHPGDTVQVGPVVFVVQIDGVPADEELQPMLTPGDTATVNAAEFDELNPAALDDAGEEAAEEPVALGADDLAAQVLAGDESVAGEIPEFPIEEAEAAVPSPRRPAAPGEEVPSEEAPNEATGPGVELEAPHTIAADEEAAEEGEGDPNFDFIVEEGQPGESDVEIPIDFTDVVSSPHVQQSHH
jgi:pSer/pThr/pTyr-binding forkhead associated (FHA) protein